MTDPLDIMPAPAAQDAADPATAPRATPTHIPSWAVLSVALLAIFAWIAVCGWILSHTPTEAERASIQKQAEAISMMAFGFFLGSSVGSRNRSAG